MRVIIIVLVFSIFATSIRAQVTDRVADRFAVIGGAPEITDTMLNERIGNTFLHGIVQQDVDHLIAPFKTRTETHQWQSEFWGKWITAAMLAYRYKADTTLGQLLERAVDGLIATQTPDGYIGNYATTHRLKQWDIWGRKYTLLGLLDYYALTGYAHSLEAARRVADHLMMELEAGDGFVFNKGNYRGMAASSVLEPICQLYRLTGDAKYLAFAEDIVRQWTLPGAPDLIGKAAEHVADRFPMPKDWFGWDQGQKAYEMMSCYEGLLELYRITGNEAYRHAVEYVWQDIYETEINVVGSGSAREMWFHGKAKQTAAIYHYQETCVTVTWLKLSHQLLRLTGESKYADAAEQTFYNALLGAVSPDGQQWAKYTPLRGQRLPGSGQCGMDLNCCEASGPRGLFNFPHHIVMQTTQGIAVNYYIAGEYAAQTPSGSAVVLKQETTYPTCGLIEFTVGLEKPAEFELLLRIPSWSVRHQVWVNGTRYEGASGSYLTIRRRWEKGDQIRVELDMRGRLIQAGSQPVFSALATGPVVLTLDSRLVGYDVAKAFTVLADEQGFVELDISRDNGDTAWLVAKASLIPEAYAEGGSKPITLTFVDYASAGYGGSQSFYNLWIPKLVNPADKNGNVQ